MAFELSTPSTTPQQTLLALVVLAALFAGVIILGYRARYSGLLRPLARRSSTLSAAKADATYSTLRLGGDTDFQSWHTREKLRQLVDPDGEVDRPTAGDALGEVRRSLAEAWLPVIMSIPRPARWLVSLAVNVSVFGAIAVSTDLILTFLRSEPRPTQDITAWPGVAASQSATVVELASALVLTIPGADVLWSVLFTVAVITWTTLYTHWYLIAALLLLGAAVVTVLDRRMDETAERINSDLPAARAIARTLGGGALAVWLATLVGIAFGRRLISNPTGVKIGLATGALATLAGVAYLGMTYGHRATHAREWWLAMRERSQEAQLLTLCRLGWLAIAAVVSPLLPVYIVVALTKLPTLLAAYLSAAPEVQVAIAIGVAAVLGVLAASARDAWADVHASLVELASHQQVKTVVFAGGMPLIAVAAGYVIVYAFVQSIMLAAALAVAMGLLVRGVYILALRVKYRVPGGGEVSATPAGRVVIQVAELVDDTGESHYYARVNGDTELLAPDSEALVDTLCDVGDELTTTGEVPATVEEWHARFAFNSGITDPEESRKKLREKVRKPLFLQLERSDRLAHWDRLARRLDKFPSDIRKRRVDKEIYLGNIQERGEHLELRNNPFKQ